MVKANALHENAISENSYQETKKIPELTNRSSHQINISGPQKQSTQNICHAAVREATQDKQWSDWNISRRAHMAQKCVAKQNDRKAASFSLKQIPDRNRFCTKL